MQSFGPRPARTAPGRVPGRRGELEPDGPHWPRSTRGHAGSLHARSARDGLRTAGAAATGGTAPRATGRYDAEAAIPARGHAPPRRSLTTSAPRTSPTIMSRLRVIFQ